MFDPAAQHRAATLLAVRLPTIEGVEAWKVRAVIIATMLEFAQDEQRRPSPKEPT